MTQPTTNIDSAIKVSNQWQSLSPIAIVFFILRFAVRFLKDGVMNLAPALAVFITQVEDKAFWAAIAAAAFVVFLVIYSILYYKTFRFKVQGDKVLLTKGVLQKETTTLQFNKVQNINLSVPFYFQPFNLVNCIFDSAGSSQKEISFPGVKQDYAESLRSAIISYKQSHKETTTNDDESAESSSNEASYDESPSLRLSVKEIAKFGLSSNMTFLLLAFLAPFMELIVDTAEKSIIPFLSSFVEVIVGDADKAEPIAVIIFVIGIIMGAVLLSVFAAIIQFYKYELFINHDSFKRIAGLFDRHQITMTKHRIQALSIKQNWVFLLFKRVTIQFHQMASLKGGSAKDKSNLSIPTLKPSDCPPIIQQAFASLAVDNFAFSRINKRFWSRTFILFWLLPVALIGGVGTYHEFGFVVTFALIPLGFVATYLRWRRYGIWYNTKFAAIKSGLIGHKITIFPIYKIQKASIVATPAMRRAKLATVQLQMAYGTRTIPYMPEEDALHFVNLALNEVETNTSHWLHN